MQPKFIALVPLLGLMVSFVIAYPSVDVAALMERGFEVEEGLMFARDFDFVDELETRGFDDELDIRDFDDELEMRDVDDELETRSFDGDILEMREFDEDLETRDFEDLFERGGSIAIDWKQSGNLKSKIADRIQTDWREHDGLKKFEKCEVAAVVYKGETADVTVHYYNGKDVGNGVTMTYHI